MRVFFVVCFALALLAPQAAFAQNKLKPEDVAQIKQEPKKPKGKHLDDQDVATLKPAKQKPKPTGDDGVATLKPKDEKAERVEKLFDAKQREQARKK
jgi:hypothetical protein